MAAIATTQTKIVFPAPPPTTNSLTNQQRSQLLRKTKKLEQLLGAAPHLIDNSCPANGPVHVDLGPTHHRRRSSVSTTTSQRSVESFNSFSSSSAASTCSSTYRLLSSSSDSSSSSRSLRRSSSLLKKDKSAPSTSHCPPSYETWSETTPPFLRIDKQSNGEKRYWPSTVGPSSSKRYTLAPSYHDSDSEGASPVSPSFKISPGNSPRKVKMDRLRRKLGQGVPIEMVFPGATSELEDDDELTSDGSFEVITPPNSFIETTGAHLRPKSKSSKRIAKSRDSLLIHHIPRHSSSSESLSSSPSSQPSPTLPPIPTLPSSPKSTKGRPLSAIPEGADEQAFLDARVGESLDAVRVLSGSPSRRQSRK